MIGEVRDLDMGYANNGYRHYVRVRVPIDAKEPLKRSLMVDLLGEGHIKTVLLRCERLLDYCFQCGRLGHSLREYSSSWIENYGGSICGKSNNKHNENLGKQDLGTSEETQAQVGVVLGSVSDKETRARPNTSHGLSLTINQGGSETVGDPMVHSTERVQRKNELGEMVTGDMVSSKMHKEEVNPALMFLLETKCHHVKLENWKIKLGFIIKPVVDCIGKGGGICLYWFQDVNVDLLSYSSAHIDIRIKRINNKSLRFTGFYWDPDGMQRRHSWTLLKHLAEMSN
ncbi:hypothetical protein Dsin_025826 [Dipteronia sinensis]|uniref:CCHC-type domain-containing protein n=1 Tax=Dipteronia sinensis TaxID=43782 RepID=A0AAD9ZWS7_9ROSI|nr:hypothetical protein Dsin_025826 [Dipteronia sinensis]